MQLSDRVNWKGDFIMKKYDELEMEVILFSAEDIIVASDALTPGEDEGDWD